MRSTVLLVALIACAMLCAAEEYTPHLRAHPQKGMIRLRSGTIHTHNARAHHVETREVSEWVTRTLEEADNHHLYLIHITCPITAAYRAGLERDLGVKITTYLPHDTFLVALTPAGAARAASLRGVGWVGVYRPGYKTAPEVATMELRAVQLRDVEDDRTDSTAPPPPNARVPELRAVTVPIASGVKPNYQAMADAHFAGEDFQVTVKVASPRRLAVKIAPRLARIGDDEVSRAAVEAVAQWLSERPLVQWVEPRPDFKTTNYWARQVTQTGYGGTTPISTTHNLTGQGQIVGIGDTGLDASSCFFYDPYNAVPYNTNSSTHRKIVQYITYVDSGDYFAGHGTHVCGSVAGAVDYQPANISVPTSMFNGIAPSAKIAFFDIGDGNGSLSLPEDLAADYFSVPYAAGARIHSNSWGSDTPLYTSDSQGVDQFMWDYKDFLVMVAAGNSGSNGLYSVGAPATAKSSVAVGAGQNSQASWENYDSLTSAILNITAPANISNAINGVLADFSAAIRNPISGQFVVAKPYLACSTLTNPAAINGNIAVITRGTCAFTVKVTNAISAGATAVVVINNDATDPFAMGGDGNSVLSGVPSFMIAKADGLALNTTLSKGIQAFGYVNHGATPDLSANGYYDLSNLAYFSSLGPTSDDRSKPDITAPGFFVVSAKSNADDNTVQCGDNWVYPNAGTSMATPVTSGNVALIRQYYMAGHYPTGVATPANALTPSAALMKATLLAAGQEMNGYWDFHTPSSYPPSQAYSSEIPLSQLDGARRPSLWQGYGRIQLDSVLMFSGSGYSTWLLDDSTGLDAAEASQNCFTVTAGASFRVALVWTDYPGDMNAISAIVNNLDLVVYDPNGAIAFGNNFTNVGKPAPDMLNTAELVYVTGGIAGTYTVVVQGKQVPMGPQPYALFVVGTGVTHASSCASSNIPCPGACSGHGTCNSGTGVCSCDFYHTGPDCSTQSTALVAGATITDSVGDFGWKYYSMTPASDALSIKLSFKYLNQNVGDADANYYVALNSTPSTTSYGWQFYYFPDNSTIQTINIASVSPGNVYILGVNSFLPSVVQYSIKYQVITPATSAASTSPASSSSQSSSNPSTTATTTSTATSAGSTTVTTATTTVTSSGTPTATGTTNGPVSTSTTTASGASQLLPFHALVLLVASALAAVVFA